MITLDEMQDGVSHDGEDYPTSFVGYIKCCDCGTLVLSAFAHQTGRRCHQCWKDHSALTTLEIRNQTLRFSARSMASNVNRNKDGTRKVFDPIANKARQRAAKRIARLFPDVYAMVLDEERVRLGLAPIAHYEPLDYIETVSKTLGFEAVYSALESEGVSDA